MDRWALHLLQSESPDESPVATVVSIDLGRACVRIEGRDQMCELAREIAEKQQELLAPGDEVRIRPRGEGWQLHAVLPRRTSLSRPDPQTGRTRTIVANVEAVVIVVSVVAPPLHPRLIDRYLTAIHRGGARGIVVVNKIDLHETPEDLAADLELVKPYAEMDVPVFPVSTETGEGIDAVRAVLIGNMSVFVGHSGVGKSSLVNALTEEQLAFAGDVDDTGRGRHTTTRSTLVEARGLRVIDTPGIRAFAVQFKNPAEIAECFPEFEAAGGCRFGDCIHLQEPGCAVRSAAVAGRISRARYESYLRLVGGD